jgi:hypothetical protein
MAATAAARRARAERPRSGPAAPRRAPARRAQRRGSASGARATAPRRRAITPPAGLQIPIAVGQRTAVAVSDLADSGLVHRLTRGRLWILLLAGLLAGIVALNVLSLSFSSSASRVAVQADAIERENSIIRGRLTSDVPSREVRAAGESAGLLMPAPEGIDYLRASANDAEIAAERLRNGELLAAIEPVESTAVEPVPVEPVEETVTEEPVPAEPVAPVEPVVPVEPATRVEPVAAVEPAPPVEAAPPAPTAGGTVPAP